ALLPLGEHRHDAPGLAHGLPEAGPAEARATEIRTECAFALRTVAIDAAAPFGLPSLHVSLGSVRRLPGQTSRRRQKTQEDDESFGSGNHVQPSPAEQGCTLPLRAPHVNRLTRAASSDAAREAMRFRNLSGRSAGSGARGECTRDAASWSRRCCSGAAPRRS